MPRRERLVMEAARQQALRLLVEEQERDWRLLRHGAPRSCRLSDRLVACIVRVSAKTISRWRKRPDWQAAFAQAGERRYRRLLAAWPAESAARRAATSARASAHWRGYWGRVRAGEVPIPRRPPKGTRIGQWW